MNIFFDETSTKLGRSYLKGICNKIPAIERIFTISIPNQNPIEIDGKEIINIDLEETISSNYNNLDKTIPVDKSVFDSLNFDSLLTLKMSDRFGSFNGSDNFEERVQMFFNHVRFWNHIIEKHKIKISVFLSVPHEPAAFLIHQLMKSKGRTSLYHEQLHLQDTYLIEENINIKKSTSFKKDELLYKNAKFTIKEFRKPDYKPFYFNNFFNDLKKTELRIKKLKFVLNELKVKKLFFNYFIYKTNTLFIRKKILKYLTKCKVTPQLNKKYIFVPLHFQPEASTSPKGNIFVFQSLMIKMLSHSLNDSDWIIYLKEHPAQNPVFGRNLEFYKELNKLENVFFINENIATRNILLSSKAVGVITGTMGLEAIFNEIPVICFGDIYYKFFHGVFPVETNQELKNAIEKISSGFKPKLSKLSNEIKKTPSNYFHGYVNYEYEEISKITFNENINLLVNNLNSYLNDFKSIGN
jgi:hypothetical protein